MKSMNKKTVICLLCALSLSAAGCGGSTSDTAEATPEVRITEPQGGDVYQNYADAVNNRPEPDSYTIAVTNSYDMYYSDDTMSAYDMDEVLQVEGTDDQTAHLTQNIDSNGMRQYFDGYYYGGRLYNTYNNISYYEDMSFDRLLESMLVPVTPTVFPKDACSSVRGGRDKDGNTVYILQLADSVLKDTFLGQYDQYGLDAFDDFSVSSGILSFSFSPDGYFIGSEAVFDTSVSLSGQTVQVIYRAKVKAADINATAVTVSDEQKAEQSAYVSYQDIDTDSIETLTSDDDSAEATVTDTFKKRLVSRLGYEVAEDGTYVSSFNQDNESYTIDFDRHIFEYSNRTIHYIYNWKSNTGQMGACSLDFTTGVEGSECQDSTLQAIRDVKSWLEMELYYCGLTLEGLQAEAE